MSHTFSQTLTVTQNGIILLHTLTSIPHSTRKRTDALNI